MRTVTATGIMLFLAGLVSISLAAPARADVVLNEIMPSNGSTIADEDGDYPDWVEIVNTGGTVVNLNGWMLTDDPDNLDNWVFPAYQLKPDEHLVVFASDKDRTPAVNHFETVITRGDTWKFLVPQSEPSTNWRVLGFDDSSWPSGPSGIGNSDDDDATEIGPTMGFYMRKTFEVDDPETVVSAYLHMDYDDGFIAYLNGVEIARANMSGEFPPYTQEATDSSEGVVIDGIVPESWSIDTIGELLVEGTNILAIQVHNYISERADLTAIPYLTLGMSEVPLQARGPDAFVTDDIRVYFHTDFKISAGGETVVLSDPNETVVDSVFTGELTEDISIGRYPDAQGEWMLFDEPTPGAANTTTGMPVTEGTVTFSLPGGFYSGRQDITMTKDVATGEIRYTTDGSVPDGNANLYDTPVTIDHSAVLRACVFVPGQVPEQVATATYIIDEPSTLPVVSLSTAPANLYDNDTGIYVKQNLYRDWEKPVHVEFFEADGSQGFSIDAGLRLTGGWARNLPMKSFAVYMRSGYGTEPLEYPLFPSKPFDEYYSFVLRNAGNDWWRTFIRDGLCTNLVRDMDIDEIAYRPVVVYLNGEFWGIHSLRERKNEDYMASNHPGVDAENVDVVNRSNHIGPDGNWVYTNGEVSVSEGDATAFNTMIDFVETHDMSIQENYEQMETMLDINGYIDFYVAGFAVGRCDWPGRNMKWWRPKTEDGLFRPLFFDLDCSFNVNERSTPSYNTFNLVASTSNYDSGRNPPWSTLMFRKLLENEEFQAEFASRYADCANMYFTADRVVDMIRSMEDELAPEMGRHLDKWIDTISNYNGGIQSLEEWHDRMSVLETFAVERQPYVFEDIAQKFGLDGTAVVGIDVSSSAAGSVTINTVQPDAYPWSGTYFMGLPVTVKAIPAPGYRFDGWEGVNSADAEVDLMLDGDTEITALFVEDSGSVNSIVINEINYNSAQDVDPGDWMELYNALPVSIDLFGWEIRDSSDDNRYVFPAGAVIESGGYVVIARDTGDFSTVFPSVATVFGDLSFGFSGDGELLRLFDDEGALVDSLTYGNTAPWPSEPDGNGQTLALIDPDLDNSQAINWKISIGYGSPGQSNDTAVTGVDSEAKPAAFAVGANYPNPFNPTTTIPFTLPQAGHVTVEIYSVLGQRVVTLMDGHREAGEHRVVFDAAGYSGGIYFYRVQAGQAVRTGRMLLMK